MKTFSIEFNTSQVAILGESSWHFESQENLSSEHVASEIKRKSFYSTFPLFIQHFLEVKKRQKWNTKFTTRCLTKKEEK